QQRIMRSTCAGDEAGTAVQSGSLSRIAATESVVVSPGNARRPASISYTTQPNAQMSVRLSTVLPRACSGDMYGAVPSRTPAAVGPIAVGELVRFRSSERLALLSIARPKSSTLTLPSGVT